MSHWSTVLGNVSVESKLLHFMTTVIKKHVAFVVEFFCVNKKNVLFGIPRTRYCLYSQHTLIITINLSCLIRKQKKKTISTGFYIKLTPNISLFEAGYMKVDRNWEYLTGSSCAAFWLTTQAQFACNYDAVVPFTWKFNIMHLHILRLLRTACQEVGDKQGIFIFIYLFRGNIRKKETQWYSSRNRFLIWNHY